MKSFKNGNNTLKPEITNISSHGFWILANNKEYFLPFNDYPWFKNAKISSILDVKMLNDKHLYWPKLDVDLSTEILENPYNYPLTFR